ncbi:hypothetical protein ACFPMF_02580 [Larkinella bovis]|uniref:Lipocalin-like domain-containing protein n=1 Tax=Larkinella bovis TaxID=683041 RepID=A0ABW0I6Z0_9BACT
MRIIVTLFILLLSVSACKKGGSAAEDVDPREQYLGTYDIDYTSKTSVTPGWPTYSEDSGKGSLTFAKGDAANELRMTVEFPGFSTETDIVKLSGSQFTMSKNRGSILFGNKKYDGEFVGTGLFEGKNVTLTTVTKVSQDGSLLQWTQSYKGLKR